MNPHTITHNNITTINDEGDEQYNITENNDGDWIVFSVDSLLAYLQQVSDQQFPEVWKLRVNGPIETGIFVKIVVRLKPQSDARRGFKMKIRHQLSADGLFGVVRQGFGKIRDHRTMNVEIQLGDALMSAFAMFSLKEPSLLAFDQRRAKAKNLKQIYGLEKIPSDTQMRTILDRVEPADIKPLFKDVFRQLQRGKVLEQMVFMEGYYLLSLDGTGYFTSKDIYCESCLQRVNHKRAKSPIHIKCWARPSCILTGKR